jgi:hypothetical protein
MIGRRFGKLVVLDKNRKHPTVKKDAYYTCRCDCGVVCEARSANLKKGHKTSCGCALKENNTSPWVGKKVGQLLVLEKLPDRRYRCLCDCGQEIVSTSMWSRAKTPDAHCRGPAHGHTRHPLYDTWRGMIRRCVDPTSRNFSNYGGRGIAVCPEWMNGFAAYARDIATLGPRPSLAHTLDRADNDGGYILGNMRWATRAEQERNKRA